MKEIIIYTRAAAMTSEEWRATVPDDFEVTNENVTELVARPDQFEGATLAFVDEEIDCEGDREVTGWSVRPLAAAAPPTVYLLHGTTARDPKEKVAMFFDSTDDAAHFVKHLEGDYSLMAIQNMQSELVDRFICVTLTQKIYFDADDEEADGLGWNVIDGGSVAARFATADDAERFCTTRGMPYYFG